MDQTIAPLTKLATLMCQHEILRAAYRSWNPGIRIEIPRGGAGKKVRRRIEALLSRGLVERIDQERIPRHMTLRITLTGTLHMKKLDEMAAKHGQERWD